MNNLMRMKGMQVLVGDFEMDPEGSDDDDPGKPRPEPGLFKRCKSMLEVDDQIRKTDKAISFIVVSGRVGVACIESGVARFVPVTIGEFLSQKMGLHCFRLKRELDDDAGAACTELVVDEIDEVGCPRCSSMSSMTPNSSGPAALLLTAATATWIEKAGGFVATRFD